MDDTYDFGCRWRSQILIGNLLGPARNGMVVALAVVEEVHMVVVHLDHHVEV